MDELTPQRWQTISIPLSSGPIVASTACFSTGLVRPINSIDVLDSVYNLDEEPDLEFATLLGLLTLNWNKLEYLIRYCIHRMRRDGLSEPAKQEDVTDILNAFLPQGKLMKEFLKRPDAPLLEDSIESQVEILIQRIGNRNVPGSLYERRCNFEHSFYGKTVKGTSHYFRLGAGKEQRILTGPQVENEKQAIRGLITEIKQTYRALNQLIPPTLGEKPGTA